MPSVVHDTSRYANNQAEVSHQPTRQRERYMRRFTLGRTYDLSSDGQRFLMIKEGGGADQTAASPVPAK